MTEIDPDCRLRLEIRRHEYENGVVEWLLDDENHPDFVGQDRERLKRQLDGARLEILFEGELIAIGETRGITLVWSDSMGSGDHDNCVAMRLVERRENAVWSELPWRDLGRDEVVYAWDHYMFGRSRSANETPPSDFWLDLDAGWAEGRLERFDGQIVDR